MTLARGALTVDSRVRFGAPYDLAVSPDGTLSFPDGGRILQWRPGDAGPRLFATTPSREIPALVRGRSGTLYAADLPGNQILRVDSAGRVTRLAEVRAPGDMVLDSAETALWVTSLEDEVFRVTIASGAVARVAPVRGSHGIERDEAGNLYLNDSGAVVRIDAATGAESTFATVDASKFALGPDGALYGGVGGPSGGRIVRIGKDGSVTPVVGTGSIGPHSDGRALDAQILPTASQFAADGTLLVAQYRPIPAIRRVDLAAGTITTLVRGD